jgi:hypothetical protein
MPGREKESRSRSFPRRNRAQFFRSQQGRQLPKKDLRGASSVIKVPFLRIARVVKWQTRTFEGRMPKGMGVQVPPRAEMPPLSGCL